MPLWSFIIVNIILHPFYLNLKSWERAWTHPEERRPFRYWPWLTILLLFWFCGRCFSTFFLTDHWPHLLIIHNDWYISILTRGRYFNKTHNSVGGCSHPHQVNLSWRTNDRPNDRMKEEEPVRRINRKLLPNRISFPTLSSKKSFIFSRYI